MTREREREEESRRGRKRAPFKKMREMPESTDEKFIERIEYPGRLRKLELAQLWLLWLIFNFQFPVSPSSIWLKGKSTFGSESAMINQIFYYIKETQDKLQIQSPGRSGYGCTYIIIHIHILVHLHLLLLQAYYPFYPDFLFSEISLTFF